jgi:hypothetical protein
LIICDTREKFAAIFRDFMVKNNIENHETGLNYNYYTDYIITENNKTVGIQRKATGEILSEMVEIRNRIFDILKMWDYAVLLVEEDFNVSEAGFVMLGMKDYYVETSFPIKNYYNFLQSLRDDGIIVVTTKNYNQSLWWMFATHERLKKSHAPFMRIDSHTPVEHAMGVLKLMSGFGEKSIEKVLGNASIKELIAMNDDELKKVGMNVTQRRIFIESINAKISKIPEESRISSVCDVCNKSFKCEDCKEDPRYQKKDISV